MFTCFIRYRIEPGKRDAFKDYARSWISLIRKYGGTHHGYFVPPAADDAVPRAAFSFPGIGTDGPPNVAVALFSFPSVEAYERYRTEVAQDEDCRAATVRFEETKCFSSYERTFLMPVFE
ncbi:MAG TPA: NIPSNAP family protein [Rhizomicrobium sp.]|jgi:hypothetical protein